MSRLLSGLLKTAGRKNISFKFNIFPTQFLRGNSTSVVCSKISIVPKSSWNAWISLPGEKTNLYRFPECLASLCGIKWRIPSVSENFTPLEKQFPSALYNGVFDNTIYQEDESSAILDQAKNDGVYQMGSLLKKRRRKMNRQKYKKRRKRDRFKREALKNLREKKQQRKERAFARKQSMLSKMVVNKTISKRRARYLAHKLLPGVIKSRGVN